MNIEVEVHGSELRLLLVHETCELGPGMFDALDEADRCAVENLVCVPRATRTLEAWSVCAFGEHGTVAALCELAARFNTAAARIGAELRVHVTTDVTAAPAFWFGFPAGTPQPHAVGAESARADPVAAPSAPPHRSEARVFVSYADADSAWAVPFIETLHEIARTCETPRIEFWYDKKNLGFGPWQQQLRDALRSSHLGLMLLTPAFLDSDYVRDTELPVFDYHGFDRSMKPCAVVECAPVDAAVVHRRGLDASQIVGCRKGGERVAYTVLDESEQRVFAGEIFAKLCDQIASLPLSESQSPPQGHMRRLEAALARLPSDDIVHLQRNEAMVADWSDQDADEHRVDPVRVDLVAALAEWAVDADAPQFCAVLGQYGTGKTTSLRQLGRELLQRRARGEVVPLPIYIDLRAGSTPSGSAFTLADLLNDHIRAREALRHCGATASDLLRLVRDDGVLMLFDGLDEKAVHMNRGDTRHFVNELWKTFGDSADEALHCRGRLVISCRSHYFRDLREQARFFLAAESSAARRTVRAGAARAAEFPLFVLLPFGPEQIHSYLVATLGDADAADRAMALIERTHDLGQLATRPVLLPHLVRQLAHLERCAARGEIVNAAVVYSAVVDEWLGRDDRKHKIDADDKRRLMEELAAKLHDEERQDLPADLLDEWLAQRFRDSDALRHYPPALAELFKTDLRTATFVVRMEFGVDSDLFRFAHTSLAEYFLACHLVRALQQQRPECWGVALPSKETLDFVAQIILRLRPHEQQKACALWAALIEGGGAAAALAFRCWLSARAQGATEPQPQHVRLDGADLAELELSGVPGRIWRLPSASFRGAWLMRTRWRCVELADADFTGALLCDAEFDDCVLDGARFDGADRGGLHLRFGSAAGVETAQAIGETGSRFALQAEAAAVAAASSAAGRAAIVARDYRSDEVLFCARSPDGAYVASARRNGCVRIVETATGHCLYEIPDWNRRGTVAFSPASRLVLVPQSQGRLALWDLARGRLERVVVERGSEVLVCAFSACGGRVLVATAAAAVAVWDLATRARLVVLARRPPRARRLDGCALSPDGRLVAIAFDGHVSLRAIGGRAASVLDLRNGDARFGVAFGDDGNTLATASSDGVVRFWSCADGRLLRSVPVGKPSRIMLSSDAVRAAVWSEDDCLQIWDLAERGLGFVYYGAVNIRAAQLVDADRLLVGLKFGYLDLYDCPSGFCVRRFDVPLTTGPPSRVVLSGNTLCVVPEPWPIRRWHLDGSASASVEIPGLRQIAVSPDLQVLAGVRDSLGEPALFDAHDGRLATTFAEFDGNVTWTGFLPDGQTVALGVNVVENCTDDEEALPDLPLRSQVELFGRATGRRLRRVSLGPRDRDAVLVPHDAGVLIWNGPQSLLDWSPERSVLRAVPFEIAAPITSVAVSPGGDRLLVGSVQGILYLCAMTDGRCLRQFRGHTKAVVACGFSGDGTRLVSVSADGTARIWSSVSDECALIDEAQALSGSLGIHGNHAAIVQSDMSVCVWNIAEARCVRRLQLLPENEYLLCEPGRHAPLAASAHAWRHCETRLINVDGGVLVLPAEALTGPWRVTGTATSRAESPGASASDGRV
jgi:WD40 repeat protein